MNTQEVKRYKNMINLLSQLLLDPTLCEKVTSYLNGNEDAFSEEDLISMPYWESTKPPRLT